jgi:ribosomal protein S17E
MRVETLLETFPEKFCTDFEKNKRVLDELDIELSRFDRNMIAGFLTRQVKSKKES